MKNKAKKKKTKNVRPNSWSLNSKSDIQSSFAVIFFLIKKIIFFYFLKIIFEISASKIYKKFNF